MSDHTQSRDRLEQEMLRSLGSALDSLASIWEEIGIMPEQRNARTEVVMVHLRNLLDKMVKEEEGLRSKLLSNVAKYTSELERLAEEMKLPTPKMSEEGHSILQLEKALRLKVDTLNKEKHTRLRTLRTLKEEDQHLCDVLCCTPYYVPSGSVPSQEQLDQLEAHVREMETEKGRRKGIFDNFKTNIVKMMDDLERGPDSSFQRDVVSDDNDSFLLSADNMKALKLFHDELEEKQQENYSRASKLREKCEDLWRRLQIPEEERAEFLSRNSGFKPKSLNAMREEITRCEHLKLANMRQVIEQTRKQLTEWYDKCYYSREQRSAFRPFFNGNVCTQMDNPRIFTFCADDFTEESLELHDRQLASVRAYYAENEEMLTNVARRQVLWDDFMEFERKAADPNRFFNRGCNLLKEEKARKKVMKELPRVEEEVREGIEAWEKANGREFLVGGVRFIDFVKQQWEDHRLMKENEKEQRHMAKVKQTEEEMLYGSKPAATTPGKRRFAGTPAKTPSKLRKMGDKTPGSASRLGRTTGSQSNVFSSPVCMPPRSALKTKTPIRTYLSQAVGSSRKVLTEKPPSNDTVFSQTTVSSSNPATTDMSSASLASVPPYNDFAKGLNQNSRPNCRSSVVPKPAAGAYF
ncbi:hypothetical protein CAPTEDRAFT_226476 [Capitella teleta]|uniref:Protein regulator of cytokinesis 1 n=1 Tax=Capitella teleta TaxID=283909 RepID=R7U8K3_CAPTE|nr:hypothetical protein CAPTEDRAFT_226476 [Capitella teleta]|eukprot:ELU02314.1 hypothetical protein CAPTEDRAFT_226476 [Capitella teleta]